METWESGQGLFFFFQPCDEVCGVLVPQLGIELVPLQWKLGVLTTGPPGKSPHLYFKILIYLLIWLGQILVAA